MQRCVGRIASLYLSLRQPALDAQAAYSGAVNAQSDDACDAAPVPRGQCRLLEAAGPLRARVDCLKRIIKTLATCTTLRTIFSLTWQRTASTDCRPQHVEADSTSVVACVQTLSLTNCRAAPRP
jgi:hypothetical protein